METCSGRLSWLIVIAVAERLPVAVRGGPLSSRLYRLRRQSCYRHRGATRNGALLDGIANCPTVAHRQGTVPRGFVALAYAQLGLYAGVVSQSGSTRKFTSGGIDAGPDRCRKTANRASAVGPNTDTVPFELRFP